MKARTLADVGEDALIARLVKHLPLGPEVLAGPGDDCAVVKSPAPGKNWLLLKTDAVVENLHFLPAAAPAAVGWKAACRAVSDIAAMGGWPAHALVTVIAPPAASAAWLEGVYRGLAKAARRFGFSIVGGETCGAPAGAPVILNVAMTGEVEPARCVRRDGARPGDALCVTGRLGGSLASGRHLRFTPRLAEARWLVSHFKPSAMMDLSDGLAKDLPRLAAMSGVGWALETARIPRHRGCLLEHALGDGEDFELLFALPSRQLSGLLAAWPQAFPRLPLSVIGRVEKAGLQTPLLRGGFAHF